MSQTTDFVPGQRVQYRYEPRGGWGYVWWIPCTVVRTIAKRVVVKIELRAGGCREVAVSPSRLKMEGTG